MSSMMTFRTFLPLDQPSFIEMPQLLGLKPTANGHQNKPTVDKGALSFILSADQPASPVRRTTLLPSFPLTSPQKSAVSHSFAPTVAPTAGPAKFAKRRRLQPKVSSKPGLVVLADGTIKKGSKYCMVDGCTSRAKHARRCWRHGGSVKCKVADCANRAKTKGVCWSHGGGTLCSFDGCSTISVSNGVCWAHGGGKRCIMQGCARPAYERTDHLCTLHFEEKQCAARLHHPHSHSGMKSEACCA